MKKFREIREEQNLWSDRWKKGSGVFAAIQYKGKVYTGEHHAAALQKMMKSEKITAKELDDNLSDENFGYSSKGAFVKSNKNNPNTKSDLGNDWNKPNLRPKFARTRLRRSSG